MNAKKSSVFMKNWENDSLTLKRKLTEFSLQLTPSKFSEMINYKKIVMENLEPEDFECEVYSDGKEVAELVTDSKMKSLCLKKAKEEIKILERSQKEPCNELEEQAKLELTTFIESLEVEKKAYGTKVLAKKELKLSKLVINETEIIGLQSAKNLWVDVLTFNEGYNHTFTYRLECENGDKYAFYSSIGRDGVKGEKPKVYASALINGYYVSEKTEHKIY